MKAGRLLAPLAIVIALTVAGCGDRGSTSPGGGGDSPLRDRTFLATTVTENGGPRQLAEKTTIRFTFTDDGRLLADAGCNTIVGPVSLGGGRIEVADMSSTGVGCDQPRHAQDEWLATFLGTKPNWRLEDTKLTVSSGNIELVMTDRKVAEPDLALQGTKWTLETIVDGQVASSSQAGTEASLVFDKETVTVATGCNRGSGGYTLSGTTIRFSAVAITKMACEQDRMMVENAVLTALTGEVSYEIDSDRLSLRLPSGKGIDLRGQR